MNQEQTNEIKRLEEVTITLGQLILYKRKDDYTKEVERVEKAIETMYQLSLFYKQTTNHPRDIEFEQKLKNLKKAFISRASHYPGAVYLCRNTLEDTVAAVHDYLRRRKTTQPE